MPERSFPEVKDLPVWNNDRLRFVRRTALALFVVFLFFSAVPKDS
jgi:hypothetical protein